MPFKKVDVEFPVSLIAATLRPPVSVEVAVEVAKKYANVGPEVAVSVVEFVHAVSMPVVPPETEAEGHVVRQGVPSPLRQSEVAEIWVDEANGSCEAVTVELAT